MKTTESTLSPGIAAFLGEAAAPEATTTVTFTGTQKAVQKAISGMAKKPAKKTSAPPVVIDDEPLALPAGDEPLDADLEAELETPAGDGDGDEFPAPREESTKRTPADIVEALIQENPAEAK